MKESFLCSNTCSNAESSYKRMEAFVVGAWMCGVSYGERCGLMLCLLTPTATWRAGLVVGNSLSLKYISPKV